MSSTPGSGQSRDESVDRVDSSDRPVAQWAGSHDSTSELHNPYFRYNGYEYPYILEASPMLVDDARAVLNGEANHLLGNDESLVDDPHGIAQEAVTAEARQTAFVGAALPANDPNTTPHVARPQSQPQETPVASAIPLVNSQVLQVAVTDPLQCPYDTCTHTFGRPEERRRHMKKHNGPWTPCIHPHCARTFYRQDKLRAHLAKGHRNRRR